MSKVSQLQMSDLRHKTFDWKAESSAQPELPNHPTQSQVNVFSVTVKIFAFN